MDAQLVLGSSSGSNEQVVLVPPDCIDKVWPIAEQFFGQDIPYWEDYCDVSIIQQALREGRCHLWLAMLDGEVRLAGLTEFVIYPRMKILRVTWITGSDVRRLKHLLGVVELWAQTNEVTRMEFLGRAGWLRTLQSDGYRFHSYLIVKDLVQMTEH